MKPFHNLQLDHDQSKRIDSALHHAELVCKKAGARLTKLRRQILELLLQEHKPLGAYELMDRLEKASTRDHVAPPTVYRSLDFLMDYELIHKVHSLNAYIARLNPSQDNIDALFICNQCGHTEEIPSPPIQQAINLSASQCKFTVEKQILEIVGICGACKRGNKA